MAPSKKLKQHAPLLLCMSKNRKLTKDLLSSLLNEDLVHCVGECACNILKGNVSLTKTQKRKLARHKEAVRSVASKNISTLKKKKIIQKGGFLSALLGPLIGSVLMPLAQKIFT